MSWRPVAIVLGVLLLSWVVVSSAVRANPGVWFVDEWTYIDYLHKVHGGQLYMPPGDVVGQAAIADTACRGIVIPGHRWLERPVCGQQDYDPTTFINGGISTASIHPPTYFWVTDVGARGVLLFGGADGDLVTAGRLAGAGWMAAGLLALLLLMRELRVPPVARALGLAVVAVSPGFVEAWQYLTPDAANVLVGSLVVLAAVRWARDRCPTWVLAVAGAGAMAVKFPNIVVVCLAACVVLVVPTAVVPWRRRVLAVGALGVSAVGTALGLLAVGSLTARAAAGKTDIDATFAARAFDPAWLLENADAFLQPFGRTTVGASQASVLGLVLLGLVGVASLGRWGGRQDALVARVLLLVLLAGPGLLVALTYLSQGEYFPVQARYGHSLVPAAVAVVAACLRGAVAQVVAGAATAVYVVVSALTWSTAVPV